MAKRTASVVFEAKKEWLATGPEKVLKEGEGDLVADLAEPGLAKVDIVILSDRSRCCWPCYRARRSQDPKLTVDRYAPLRAKCSTCN